MLYFVTHFAFSALTLLVGRQKGHLACKKTEWWGAGMVVCLEQGADLHMAQLMPLPLTVSCFTKIQIGFTFLVPAHPGSPGKRAIKRLCVCVFVTHYLLVLPFWYQLTWVVPKKWLLNVCVCVCVSVFVAYIHSLRISTNWLNAYHASTYAETDGQPENMPPQQPTGWVTQA